MYDCTREECVLAVVFQSCHLIVGMQENGFWMMDVYSGSGS